MKLTKKQINDIAQDLECGMKVFINRETLDIKTILDWDEMYGDTEIWDQEMEEIDSNWSNYVVIEKLESHEAFKIMEAFVDEVDDEHLQRDLIKILNRRSPFANFKDEVETSAYREKWFEFRTAYHEEYVRKQLELENIEIEK